MNSDFKTMTMVMVRTGDRLLLGRKKRGFGQGKWLGIGGKIEAGESIEQAARREFSEETGANVQELSQVGRLTFTFANGLSELEMHVFAADRIEGTLKETAEIAPRWFSVKRIPFSQMWPDSRHWLPLFLTGRRFAGSFHYADEKNLLQKSLILIDDLVTTNQRNLPQDKVVKTKLIH
jgi:8-oxo-dGTP pyrophosphatase MutT (NUDIX family)